VMTDSSRVPPGAGGKEGGSLSSSSGNVKTMVFTSCSSSTRCLGLPVVAAAAAEGLVGVLLLSCSRPLDLFSALPVRDGVAVAMVVYLFLALCYDGSVTIEHRPIYPTVACWVRALTEKKKR
jgi:hypothetical protein